MTKQSGQKTFRKIMIGYSIFEMLLCSGPIFGWASLAYILKKENYFADFCAKIPNHQNSSSISGSNICRQQENSLNIAYTVGFLTVGLASFPVGYLLDISGPKVARYTSSALFGISSAFWINFTKESQQLIYPAVLTLSAAGVFSSFAFFQVTAFFCRNHQSTVLGLQNGAFNASAVVMHVIKVLYEIQKLFRIEILLALYCGLSSVLVLCATFIFVPSKKDMAKHAANRSLVKDALLKECVEVELESCQMPQDNANTEINGYCEDDKEPFPENVEDPKENILLAINDENVQGIKKQSIPNEWISMAAVYEKSCSASNLDVMSDVDNMKLTAFNVILKGSKISINSFIDLPRQREEDSVEGKLQTGEIQEKKLTLCGMLFSGIFLWHLFFASVFHLRVYYFISTFENLLLSIYGSNEEIVNRYINILGIAQFVGVIFAPLLGPYIDKNPTVQMATSFQDYRMWKIKRCANALAITVTISVLMGIVVLIPLIPIQIIAIAAQVILRGFFYAVHFTFFAVLFPPEHYGKLSSLSLLMGVLFGSLQYPLCLLTEIKFGNNPFWVNVGLLLLSLVAYGQPIHLRKHVKNCSA